jgi:hypothetical protein
MKYTLSQAVTIIAYLIKISESEIISIEYEDGSGKNFIFSVKGKDKQFIKL